MHRSSLVACESDIRGSTINSITLQTATTFELPRVGLKKGFFLPSSCNHKQMSNIQLAKKQSASAVAFSASSFHNSPSATSCSILSRVLYILLRPENVSELVRHLA